MTRTLALAAALLFAAVPLAHAQRVSRITGGKLLAACGNPHQRLVCEGYISGVADGIAGAEKYMNPEQGHSFAGATCIPNDTRPDQLHTVVVTYLKSHDADLAKPAAIPTYDALHAAFPCKQQ